MSPRSQNTLLTDTYQADILGRWFEGDILYDQNLNRWYRFNPKTGMWLPDLGEATILADVQRHAQQDIQADDIRGDTLEARTALLNVPVQARALEALRVRPAFRVTNGEWDTVPHLLGCKNGVLDLREHRLLKPEEARQHRLTMNTGLDFHEGLKSDLFTKHMALVQPDPVMRAYLFRVWGYTLTGERGEQLWWFNYGPTARNGKTQTYDALRLTMGDYGQQIRRELVVRNERTSAIDFGSALHAIAKARLGELPELSQVGELNSEFIKQLVDSSASAIPYRVPYGRGDFYAQPPITVHGHGNSRPEVRDSNEGFWRRVRVVPWTVQVPKGIEVKDYGDFMFREEGEAILSLIAAQSALWYETARVTPGNSGLLREPPVIEEQTKQYRDTSDHFAQFVTENLDVTHDPKDRIGAQWLFDRYNGWCEKTGIRITQRVNGNKFPERMLGSGSERTRAKTGMVYLGVRWLGGGEDGAEEA